MAKGSKQKPAKAKAPAIERGRFKGTDTEWLVQSGQIVTKDGVHIGGADRNEPATAPWERDANVKMMAASLRMYDFAINTAAWCQAVLAVDGIKGRKTPPAIRKLWDEARQVIALAEGRPL